MNTFTCDFCNSQIPAIPDGRMRFCACQCLGIDHTPEYTRYIGAIPREHPDFNQWAEKNKVVIDKIKAKVAINTSTMDNKSVFD